MQRTLDQNNQLHALLTSLNIDTDNKKMLVAIYSNGRSVSSKDLTYEECKALITDLKSDQGLVDSMKSFKPGDKQRKKILSLCYDMGRFLKYDHDKEKMQVDKDRLNRWLLQYGVVKRKFEAMTEDQLNQTVTQLQKMAKRELKRG